MRVGVLQLNPVVGDLAGNLERHRAAFRRARDAGARLLVGPELGILGYPPRDLLWREGIEEQCRRCVDELAREVPADTALLVGLPLPGAMGLHRNGVALCRGGQVEQLFVKRLLPTYDVFDEARYFLPGELPLSFEHEGARVGVLICEDLWRADDVLNEVRYDTDPLDEIESLDVDVLAVLSASPFVIGKRDRHRTRLAEVARRLGAPVVSVNEVGANDDLVFDGGSTIHGADGSLRHASPTWRADVTVHDLAAEPSPAPDEPLARGLSAADRESFDVWRALELALFDYCEKTAQTGVLLGLSGGIDSALCAAIAAAALGGDRVHGVLMPSRHSSDHSIEDAHDLVERCGIARSHVVPIEPAHQSLRSMLAEPLGDFGGLADENAQSRTRGTILMTMSNALGGIVLATGNKSELAVGYSTLYGDMCGGVSLIGDLVKTRVWSLSRFANEHHALLGFERAPIPPSSIEKPPSAELRPDQFDTDSLPPYEKLDAIIAGHVEREWSIERIAREIDADRDEVAEWCRRIDRAEYKRFQAAIIPKVTPRTFGPGRPMPMAMRTPG